MPVKKKKKEVLSPKFWASNFSLHSSPAHHTKRCYKNCMSPTLITCNILNSALNSSCLGTNNFFIIHPSKANSYT